MTDEQKAATIKEFNFTKGILVATFSGIMSACFAYGLDAAAPIAELSAKHGTDVFWTGLPKLCVVLLGGFTTNFIWCVVLNVKNRTGYQYFSRTLRASWRQRRRPGADAAQLPVQRTCRRGVVSAVLLLLDGRDADGRLQILQLDAPHGEHHHLQFALGDRAEGVGGKQPFNEADTLPRAWRRSSSRRSSSATATTSASDEGSHRRVAAATGEILS